MDVKPMTTMPELVEAGCGGVESGARPVADITAVLQALGDPVRLEIVKALAEHDDARPCGSFQLQVTKSTLSHHFRVLWEAGLIDRRCEGTRKLLSLRRTEVDAVYPGLLESVLGAHVGAAVAG
jgi:DNA-binding transcriptional ArsR family regulator